MTPERRKGFNYYLDDSIPVWLSIHKCWQESTTGAPFKPFALKAADGEITEFKSRAAAAVAFECTTFAVKDKIGRAHKKPDKRIRFKGVWYTLIESVERKALDA